MKWLYTLFICMCLTVGIGISTVSYANPAPSNAPAATAENPPAGEKKEDDGKTDAEKKREEIKKMHRDIGSDVHLTAEYIKLQNPSLTNDFEKLAQYVHDECKARGVEVTQALALIEKESNWRMIPSYDGLGYGVGQLSYKVPGGAYLDNSEYKYKYDLDGPSDLFDLHKNLHGSIYHWRLCRDTGVNKGDPFFTYAKYNAGPGHTNPNTYLYSEAGRNASVFMEIYMRLKSGDPGVPGGGGSDGRGKIVWMLDGLNEIAKILKKTIDTFVGKALDAFKFLTDAMIGILYLLVLIDFLVFMIFSFGNLDLQVLIARIIRYGFIAMFLQLYKYVMFDGILGLIKVIAGAFSTQEIAITALRDPGQLLQHLVFVLMPIFTKLSNYNMWDYIASFGVVMLTYFIAFATLLLFVFVFFKLTAWFIEFYFLTALSVVSIPFLSLQFTKFLPEGMIGAAVSAGLKLLMATAVIGILFDPITKMQAAELQSILETVAFAVNASLLLYLLVGIPERIMKHWGGSIEL